MLSTCFARNLCNSKSSTDKFSIHSSNSQEYAQNRTSPICAARKALLGFQDCESQPVKETKYDVHEADYSNPDRFIPTCNPPDECESVDSHDVSMINIIREMAGEEQRLNEELKELTEKELAFKKAMDFCTTMFNEKTVVLENPELARLKGINRDLLNKKKILIDNLADAKLEFKQLKERIDGPLKRELERARRQCMECECRYNDTMNTETDIASNEVTFLKQQLQNTCNNINDIQTVNTEIRKEVAVLNLKCKTLQELLIKNKVNEINTLKQVCTCKDE